MMANLAIVARRHPVGAYFLLALGISWLIEISLALWAQGESSPCRLPSHSIIWLPSDRC